MIRSNPERRAHGYNLNVDTRIVKDGVTVGVQRHDGAGNLTYESYQVDPTTGRRPQLGAAALKFGAAAALTFGALYLIQRAR